MTKVLRTMLMGVALAAVTSGCHKGTEAGSSANGASASTSATATPADTTLGAALGKTAQFSTVAAAVKDTGLEGVMDGRASYTLFAPTNTAFDALGDKGAALRQPEQRAALAALLREHIVPGMLTRADLDAALARAGSKPLKLRSMGKGTLSLSKEGDAIVVSGTDGSKAKLTGDATSAKNGAALGIDGVLKKLG